MFKGRVITLEPPKLREETDETVWPGVTLIDGKVHDRHGEYPSRADAVKAARAESDFIGGVLDIPNDNCLDGLQCPRCGSREPFEIGIRAIATVYDSGTDGTRGYEWDANSPARCVSCDGEWVTVADFKARENEEGHHGGP